VIAIGYNLFGYFNSPVNPVFRSTAPQTPEISFPEGEIPGKPSQNSFSKSRLKNMTFENDERL